MGKILFAPMIFIGGIEAGLAIAAGIDGRGQVALICFGLSFATIGAATVLGFFAASIAND